MDEVLIFGTRKLAALSCNEIGSMWRNKGPYSASRLTFKGSYKSFIGVSEHSIFEQNHLKYSGSR